MTDVRLSVFAFGTKTCFPVITHSLPEGKYSFCFLCVFPCFLTFFSHFFQILADEILRNIVYDND